MQYEYKLSAVRSVFSDHVLDHMEKSLNRMASQGWELDHEFDAHDGTHFFVFRRPVSDSDGGVGNMRAAFEQWWATSDDIKDESFNDAQQAWKAWQAACDWQQSQES